MEGSLASEPHNPYAAAPQQRTLPPMRIRKNSDDFIYIETDVYQTAFMNI